MLDSVIRLVNMAGVRDEDFEMEESFARFSLEDEEQGELVYVEESAVSSEIDTRWCLVGRFLTDCSIDFQAMQHKMASLWRPGRGMYVKQLDVNRFLFQFYHEIDIKRVCDGSPWTFGRFHLVFERLREGMDPRTMVINNLDIWVQLHGVGTGFMAQRVVQDIGNHIGQFVESDVNNFVGVWREYFRVRVSIPLNVPLKRRMRLRKSETEWCWVTFKYEAIPTFCFICGLIGHSDKFCSKLFDMQSEEIERPYGSWMRAEPKRRSHTIGNKWLRPGGAIPASQSGETDSDKSTAVNAATDNSKCRNSGSDLRTKIEGKVPAVGENQGIIAGLQDRSQQLVIFHNDSNSVGNLNSLDNNDIIVNDPKRRRTAQDNASPDEVMFNSPNGENMQDILQNEQLNQKNLIMAGTAMQSRHSS